MPRLYVYPKKGDSFHYDMTEGKISIGRSAENEIAIPDPFCSGHHAVIFASETGYFVRDNASKNGVYLNGKKIQFEAELKKGDEVLIGSARIIFDKELSTNVEMTDVTSPTSNINTIMNLKDILSKSDIKTTLKDIEDAVDMEKIKSEHKAFAILSEVSQALVLHKPLNELLEHIMGLICEHLPMDRGILMLREGSPSQLIPKVIRINNKKLQNQKIQVSQSIVDMAFNDQLAVLTSDAIADPRFKSKDSVITSNIHSAMCAPLWNNKEIIGIIYADRITRLDQFSNEDLRLLTLLSNLAAVKIENALLFDQAIEKEKMEKELELAARIQTDFLPKFNPSCENFEIQGMNVTCYQVGGDYFDFIEIDSCRLGIIIGDVSGKGVSASLLMASLRASLHAEINPEYDLEKMAIKLNNFVHQSSAPNCFISFFFGELDRKKGDLRYVNAGHNPPIILDKKGKVQLLESSGFCLGMFTSVNYEVRTARLNKGDICVLFTDGITESRNPENEEFTEENLIEILRKNTKLSASELVDKIFEDIDSFTGGADQLDDQTLIVIKRIA